jgi:hypothetical protein
MERGDPIVNEILEERPMAVIGANHDGTEEKGQSQAVETAPCGLFTERLLWKIDRHLLVPMFLLNFFSLMGRTNIGATLIQKLPQDLSLGQTEVFLVLTMPAVSLILFDVPSNLLMRYLERKIHLGYMRYLCLVNIGLGESLSNNPARSRSS